MGFFEKFKQGLKKTRESFFGKMKNILSGRKLDEETKEEIEELLILSDVGFEATEYILNRIEEMKDEDAYAALKKVLLEILDFEGGLNVDKKPYIINMVGVNGSGKTTTAGKLAKYFSDSGKSVVLAACDTFRAAAINQLKIWADRTSATLIAHQEGADSAAVAFDAVSHAVSKEKDIVILDTAGRLHTKKNLMEELIIDAVTGQNGLQQAKIFKEFVDITGVVLTKLDGTAKGGIVIAIAKELGIPIKFIGLGEGPDDLKPFNAQDFVNALLEG